MVQDPVSGPSWSWLGAVFGRVIGVVLVALMFAGALSGCAGHDDTRRNAIEAKVQNLRNAVTREVFDPVRGSRLQRAVDGYEVELISFDRVVIGFNRDLKALNAGPGTTRADFDIAFDRYDIARKAHRQRILDWHQALIADTTAEEWRVLSRYERDALVAASL